MPPKKKQPKLTDLERADKAQKLQYSRDLYARREGNHPAVKAALDFLHLQIKAEYNVKKRYEKKYRHHIRVFVLDLFTANQIDPELYITYSRNKNDYIPGTKYRSMFLSYPVTMKVIDFLIGHGYIEHNDAQRLPPFRKLPRIKATEKLIGLLDDEYKIEVGMYIWDWDENSPTVILRDENKEDMEYAETDETLKMKEELRILNRNLERHAILLYLPDIKLRKMLKQMRKGAGKGVADFSRKWIRRIFNNGRWDQGGRCYGVWCQNIPREYRHFIRIDGKDVVECDYSGLHINMLYAKEKLPMPEGDVYYIPGYPTKDESPVFRDFVKQLLLTMVNSENREKARGAIHQAVYKDKTLQLPDEISSTKGEHLFPLMDAFGEKHQPVRKYFCSGAGIDLQYLDSQIALRVMLHFAKMGYAILPMHDSFILHHGLEPELKDEMNAAFRDMFGVEIEVDLKYNSIDKHRGNKKEPAIFTLDPAELLENDPAICTLTLREIFEERAKFSVYHKLLDQFRNYK